MKKLKYVFYGLGLLLLATNCTKKDPLPNTTQQGLNTFGCKIDGVAWIPTGTSGPGGTKPTRASLQQDGSFGLFAGSPEYLLDLVIPGIGRTNKGEYTLNNLEGYGYLYDKKNYGYLNDKKVEFSYLTDRFNIGKVTILFADTTRRIISGTFYFKAKDRNSDKVIDITDGRFDLKY